MDRQKILLLFGAAWVSAAGLTWFLYAKTKAPKKENMAVVIAAARDMGLGSLVRKSDVKQVRIPERDVPRGALFQERQAIGRVLLYPVTSNEPLTLAKLSAPNSVEGISSTIEPGYRAVSVPLSDVSGAGGLIQPNSRVDVLYTRPGNMAEAITTTVLQNVRVLSIGRVTQAGQTPDAKESRATSNRTPVATLVVTPEQAQKLELAKNEGKISLALRNPQDENNVTDNGPVTTDALDPMISARLARARKGRTTAISRANLDDPKVWQQLTGEQKDWARQQADEEARRKKEADKPRVVVDVYHGDKHVQELFR